MDSRNKNKLSMKRTIRLLGDLRRSARKLTFTGLTMAIGAATIQAQSVLYPNSSADALKRAFNFGSSVSTDGNYLAVGDYQANGLDQSGHLVAGSGEVTLFVKQNGTWVFKQRLKPRRLQDNIDYCFPNNFHFDNSQNRETLFGLTVVLKNDLLLVSSPRARKLGNTNVTEDGIVYAYRRNASTGFYDVVTNMSEISDVVNGGRFSDNGLKFNGTYIAINSSSNVGSIGPWTSLHRYTGSSFAKVRSYLGSKSAAITSNHILATNNGTSLLFEKYNTSNNTATVVNVPSIFSTLSSGFGLLESDGSTIVASTATGLRVFEFTNDAFLRSYDINTPFGLSFDFPTDPGLGNFAGHITIKEGKTIHVTTTGGALQFNFDPIQKMYIYATTIWNGLSSGTSNNLALSNTELVIGRPSDGTLPRLSASDESCPSSTSTALRGSHGATSVLPVTSPCAQNYEPNETSASATAFATNSTVYAGIATNGDKDYYKLVLTNAGTIKLWLGNLEADYNIELYNATNNRLAFSQNTGTADEFITFSAPAGTYSVYVYGQNGVNSNTACYKLNNTVIYPCNTAFEPNEGLSTATAFNLNTTVQSSIATVGDQDFFKIVTTSRGNINLSLTNLFIDLDLELMDNTGKVIAASRLGGPSNESIASFYVIPGTYYVRVFSYFAQLSDINCYNLSSSFVVGNCTDNNETNNTLAQAKALFFDKSATVFGNVNVTGDEDWFTFTTNTFSGTNIQVKLSELVSDFDLDLYDMNGVGLTASVNGGGFDEKINWANSVPATYYVKVYGFAGNTNAQCYMLSINTANTVFARLEETEATVEKESPSAGMTMIPNPAISGESVELTINGNKESTKVRVLSLSGVMVSEQDLSIHGNKATLSLSNIQPGMYLISAGDVGNAKLLVK